MRTELSVQGKLNSIEGWNAYRGEGVKDRIVAGATTAATVMQGCQRGGLEKCCNTREIRTRAHQTARQESKISDPEVHWELVVSFCFSTTTTIKALSLQAMAKNKYWCNLCVVAIQFSGSYMDAVLLKDCPKA